MSPRNSRGTAGRLGPASESIADPTLSVLDLVPVRTDQATGDAVAATLSLARAADELGYERYWLAEHHNMPAVAATNPPVLIGLVAGATERIRVGLGRRDAAEPRAAGGRRAVRAARGGVPGPDRPRHRPGARQRPGHAATPCGTAPGE